MPAVQIHYLRGDRLSQAWSVFYGPDLVEMRSLVWRLAQEIRCAAFPSRMLLIFQLQRSPALLTVSPENPCEAAHLTSQRDEHHRACSRTAAATAIVQRVPFIGAAHDCGTWAR